MRSYLCFTSKSSRAGLRPDGEPPFVSLKLNSMDRLMRSELRPHQPVIRGLFVSELSFYARTHAKRLELKVQVDH